VYVYNQLELDSYDYGDMMDDRDQRDRAVVSSVGLKKNCGEEEDQ